TTLFRSTIKADPSLQTLPVILLTTLNTPLDIIQGLECGADNFIPHPCPPAYLVRRVRSIPENRRLRAQEPIRIGVEILFLGRRFTITSEKEQILDLLVSTFEDIVRTNRLLEEHKSELAKANAKVEEYARRLEDQVRVSEDKYRTLMEHASDAIVLA